MGEKNLHAGHRQRLKNKVRNGGLKVLSEHEILELLLTYSIPFKDTNALSHTLINQYGSISGVIDANYNELKRITGVGEETALFMRVLREFVDVYRQSKVQAKEYKVTTILDIVNFFRSTEDIKDNEHLYIYGVSKRNTIVNKYETEGEDDCAVTLDFKDVISRVYVGNVEGVFLVHTHPHGEVLPSVTDIDTTKRFKQVCDVLGLPLHDHIIINENDYFSFRQNGILSDKTPKQYLPQDFGNEYIGDRGDKR